MFTLRTMWQSDHIFLLISEVHYDVPISLTYIFKLSHRSSSKSTLWEVVMKGFLLLSHIIIWTYPLCFPMTQCPSATSMYLSIPSNEPRKIETWGVIWHVDPKYKIIFVNWKLLPKSILELSSLTNICAIYAYIYWLLSSSPSFNSFFDTRLPFSLKRILFCLLLLSSGGFGNWAIRWSTDLDLKHLERGS